VAKILADGEIVAWFQGRSECGPRALGHRSILANPIHPGIKERLNRSVKFRESFRPYGCTIQWEKAHHFFDLDVAFEGPFMSFSIPVKSQFQEVLKEILHIDGTSRIQTLHEEQNPTLHALLGQMEIHTGFPILLNTSLNIMNEPIVETIHDIKRFMEESVLDYLVIENFIIRKK
jgi:carbamoyltransferase